MACLSEATGEILMTANSPEVLEELKKCFDAPSHWAYNISCVELNDQKIIESSWEEKDYGFLQYYIVCKFNGTGDRFFGKTIAMFQDWLEKKISGILLQDFSIAFKYIDQNSKLNFINDEETMLIHASGKSRLRNRCIYGFTHEYTLVNKAKDLERNLNEVIADEFEYKHNSEIVSILRKEREEIEEYTGKLLEVYLYENGLGIYAELIA